MRTIERMTAGIDWLSCSLAAGAENEAQWVRQCQEAIEIIAKEGYQLQARGLLGYRGLAAGNCFIGARDDGSYLQLTGYHANRWFHRLYRADLHVSRIDIQVTVQYETEVVTIAKEAYAATNLDNNSLPENRRRKSFIIIGSDGGDTCYIGAPSSDQRGRIYNKARQSGERAFDRCWRYEVLYRNDLAGQCANSIAAAPKEQEARLLALVCLWYIRRGVDPGFSADMGNLALPKPRTLPTEVERKLEWIRRQVMPSIRWLRSVGYGSIIADILASSGEGTTQPAAASEVSPPE
jgi:Replication initiation factor